MMLPIVIRASEEAMKLVPLPLRQASYALGATQVQTVVKVLIPAALPAIITAVFLAIARIAGETAPVLFTAGFTNFWPHGFGERLPSLPVAIYNYHGKPDAPSKELAWAAALVLMILVMILNFGVRLAAGKRVLQASRSE